LIAELYNAGVIGSGLIYDLIRGFISASPDSDEIMGEKEVESLLKLLRCTCGNVSLWERLTVQVAAVNCGRTTRRV
jgi:hypothetical protein